MLSARNENENEMLALENRASRRSHVYNPWEAYGQSHDIFGFSLEIKYPAILTTPSVAPGSSGLREVGIFSKPQKRAAKIQAAAIPVEEKATETTPLLKSPS